MIKSAHPEIGEDIKVMGVRRDRDVHLTVAVAFVGANLNNTEDYLVKKAGIYNAARAVACWLLIRKDRSSSMPPMCHLTASILTVTAPRPRPGLTARQAEALGPMA